MMKAKLIIAGEERWLTNFHYEYFFPIENNPDFDGGRLPLSESFEPVVASGEATDNEWFFKPVQIRPNETFDSLIRPNDGIDGSIRYQMAGGLFNLSFLSTEQDEFFLEWLMLGTMKEGKFEIYKGDDDHFMKIEFWDCYCVGFHEAMALGSSPMEISLRLSPAITRNRNVVEHEKNWKVTDIHGEWKAGSAVSSGAVAEEVAAKLVSVELIDSNNQDIQGGLVQYVNLPSNATYVNGQEIQDMGQLGQNIRCKVVFDKPGVHNFKLKIEPDLKNLVYSQAEITRNANFKYQDQKLSLTTNSNGEVIVEGSRLFVSPAAGDIFSVSATDDNGVKLLSNGFIQTERLLYYVEVKMDGLTSIASNLNPFVRQFKRNGVTLKALGSVNMPHMKNIGTNADSNTFRQNVQAALIGSAAANYNPHCLTIAYTDHLAVKKNLDPHANTRGGSDRTVNVAIKDEFTGEEFALWHNLDGEDWFISCAFIPTDGSPEIPIAKDKCTPRAKADNPGYFHIVDVDVRALPTKAGKIQMEVHVVEKMRGGLSLHNSNIVAVCTRHNWTDRHSAQQNLVAIHEVGHQLGMASDGSGPDKIPSFYSNNQGHVGPHCHFGIPAGQVRYDAISDFQRSRCVMYGAAGNHSAFCRHCAEALKKADLKNGV
ncbi:MAG: hypothetical protein LC643_02215 [Bacteroidales bacterium]|nr:hypothetical protein [Bacteroidales bacterium]